MIEGQTAIEPHPLSAAYTTVWAARHGEVHNPRGLLYGRLPRWGLSAEGSRQARALAEFLAPQPLTAIYSSPMLRARKTAEMVQTCHPELQVRLDRDLLEVRTGWQGHPVADLDSIKWDFYTHRLNEEDETLLDIETRVRHWLSRALRRHRGKHVLGVTHGDPLLVLLASVRGTEMTLRQIRKGDYIPTACVFRFDFDEQDRCFGQTMFVPHRLLAS